MEEVDPSIQVVGEALVEGAWRTILSLVVVMEEKAPRVVPAMEASPAAQVSRNPSD
jgi:hypothetical protein